MKRKITKKRRVARGVKRFARGVAGMAKPRYHVVAVSKDGYVKRFSVRGLEVFEVLGKINKHLRFPKRFHRVGAGRYADADNEWMVYITEAPALADIFEDASRDTQRLLVGRSKRRG